MNGCYSQKDVMEIARCLSGWRISRSLFQSGKVQFEPGLQDSGSKSVLGQTIPARKGMEGSKDFDDVLRIAATYPATAKHLATKLCRHFIDDNPPAPAVEIIASEFSLTNGYISETLRVLFTIEEFRNQRGNKFKQSIHLIASALRATDAETDAGHPLIRYLISMGPLPFEYPSPDGYSDVADALQGTLLWRWNFTTRFGQGQIQGASIDFDRLAKRSGALAKLAYHVLGRTPHTNELAAVEATDNPLGLLLDSPGFQWSQPQ